MDKLAPLIGDCNLETAEGALEEFRALERENDRSRTYIEEHSPNIGHMRHSPRLFDEHWAVMSAIVMLLKYIDQKEEASLSPVRLYP